MTATKQHRQEKHRVTLMRSVIPWILAKRMTVLIASLRRQNKEYVPTNGIRNVVDTATMLVENRS